MAKPRFDDMGFLWGTDKPETEEDRAVLKRQMISTLEVPPTTWKPLAEWEWPNLRNASWIGVDTETYDPELDDAGAGWARDVGHIIGISLAWDGGKIYLPMRHTHSPEQNYDPINVLKYVAYQLATDCPKIGAHLTYDIGWLHHEWKKHGIKQKYKERVEVARVRGKHYDVQYAESLLDETSKVALEGLGWKYLKRGKMVDHLKEWCLKAYGGPQTKWRSNLYRSPPALVGHYAEDDAEMPYQILRCQWPLLVQYGLMPVFEMECALINLLVDMRFKGVQVDLPHAERLVDEFDAKETELIERAKYIYGVKEINVNAPESLARAFDTAGITYYNTDAGNPSFTKDFLNTVPGEHGIIIRAIRFCAGLKNTFLKSYILGNNVNSKIYCTLNQMKSDKGGTRTGRFACSDPNLQNIPIREDPLLGDVAGFGKRIRAAFIPDIGHLQFRDYDYSQIEYRMLAHFATGAGADELRARFNNDPNIDYHNFVASLIARMPGYEHYVEKKMRGYVKNVNFGVVYGVGIEHMAELLNMSVQQAKIFLEAVHSAMPYARSTMDDLSTEVNRTGIVTTLLGRRSHFDLWEPEDWNMRKGTSPLPFAAARSEWGMQIMRAYLYRALNYRLQGSAADMIKKAMLLAYESGVYDVIGVPRLQVHDEMLHSDDGSAPDDAWAEMAHIFETAIPCRVPIRFDGSVGQNWLEAH